MRSNAFSVEIKPAAQSFRIENSGNEVISIQVAYQYKCLQRLFFAGSLAAKPSGLFQELLEFWIAGAVRKVGFGHRIACIEPRPQSFLDAGFVFTDVEPVQQTLRIEARTEQQLLCVESRILHRSGFCENAGVPGALPDLLLEIAVQPEIALDRHRCAPSQIAIGLFDEIMGDLRLQFGMLLQEGRHLACAPIRLNAVDAAVLARVFDRDLPRADR